MKNTLLKQEVMKNYYSDKELESFMDISVKHTLKWLEEGRLFFSKATPQTTKKLRARLVAEGW